MSRMRRILVAGVLLSSSAISAQALDTGNEMISGCQQILKNAMTAQSAYCLGSVSMLVLMSPFLESEFEFCPPSKATPEQAVRVVVKHMEDHPAELSRPFSFIGLHALRQAWPCKK